MTRTVWFGLIIVLAGAMSASAFGQTIRFLAIQEVDFPIPRIHGPGPSGAQVAGVVAILAAVTGTVLYFTLRTQSITGCAQSSNGTSSLKDEKDNRTYVLVSDHVALPKTGERFKLKGKKIKGAAGKYTFKVKKVGKDYGPCQLIVR